MVSCAKEVEALPRKLGHAVDLCTKLRYTATVTCADGHGWPRRARLHASDLLAGHGSGAAIKLEAPQVRACRYRRSGWHRTHGQVSVQSRIAKSDLGCERPCEGRTHFACRSWDGAGRAKPVAPSGSCTDPETGRVRIRLVNVESSSYRVAREYMIRLDREDLADPGKLGPMAQACGLTPEAFRGRHGYLAED